MKKLMNCILMMVILTAVVLSSTIISNAMLNSSQSTSEDTGTAVTSWAAPDQDNLAYYGFDDIQTKLPVLYIDTQNQYITKENPSRASMAVLNAPEEGTHSVYDTPDYSEAITIKYRGASSYAFDKKQYLIKFVKSQTSVKAKNVSFLGMGENDEWVLNGPFLDKTMLRNWMVYSISRQLFEWAPDTRFTELFLDGKYQGLYLVTEPVTNGTSRLRLSKFGLLSGQTAYILNRNRINSDDDQLDDYATVSGLTSQALYITYPSSKHITDLQKAWIKEDISSFEKVLYSDDFADQQNGYQNYIDMDAFADYYMLNEVMMNADIGMLSMYVYKELGGVLKPAVWDYNNCLDNYQWFQEDNTEFLGLDGPWFSEMLKDKAFVRRVVTHYQQLRSGILSDENINAMIDSQIQELGDAINRNFAVWGYTFDMNLLTGKGRDLKTYQDAIDQLKTMYAKRTRYLDEHFADLFDRCTTDSEGESE